MNWPDPFIVAELSGNHNGSLSRAMELVDAAHAAGADAIKTQCFDPETLTLDSDAPEFRVEWQGEVRTLIALYRETAMPWDWHETLFAHAKSLGMQAFASVFCNRSVDHIASLDPSALKIASLEIVDTPLIAHAASKGKPLIISCGMANDPEIVEALNAADWEPVTLLHCPPGYPAGSMDLQHMVTLEEYYGVPVGLSDHSLSTTLPAVAVGLGASVIEKHLTLSREDGGADAEFSLEPDEFWAMTQACREAKEAMRTATVAEPHRSLRRSLYVIEDMRAGEEFTADNVRSIRPGNGLSPGDFEDVLGRSAMSDIRKGTALAWGMVG